jgi:predicted nucleic acid-binding protein
MLVLLDTNVVLEVLLERQPWFKDSRALWKAHLDERITAYLTATSITNVFYIARRLTTQQQAWTAVERCLRTFEIISVDRRMLTHALTLLGRDFEDNLEIAAPSHD